MLGSVRDIQKAMWNWVAVMRRVYVPTLEPKAARTRRERKMREKEEKRERTARTGEETRLAFVARPVR